MPSIVQEIHHVGHLDNPEVEIVFEYEPKIAPLALMRGADS